MKILQVLPALYSGGVERGTVEFASDLVRQGHDSFVVSNGGPMVEQLVQRGSRHIKLPVHRKSPASFGQILPMRDLLRDIKPDIVHVRSRMPAWITWLACKGLPRVDRPALVSTFHGMYSVNAYSAIMAKADHVIAVSDCVRNYVLNNFKVAPEQLTVIQRGVDVDGFRERKLDTAWRDELLNANPQLKGKRLIMMPGRISRWKGQLNFLEMMALIRQQNPDCHGIVVGGVEPGKDHFMTELEQRRKELDLGETVSFLGQRNDMGNLYLIASLVCHMSTKPEPFGRTVTEALASGTPVVAFDRGGAAETLRACFPVGLVTPDDTAAFAKTALRLLAATDHTIDIPWRFRLEAQTETTLRLYHSVLAARLGTV
ncbi:MAG: glycosyltransferase family 4 protein [Marinobacter sp.]|uniref:glycosyltransferase family 4 protein n=1 Tax=Marinobacter sp. TaxID=50741 RepID=UPI0034A09B1D